MRRDLQMLLAAIVIMIVAVAIIGASNIEAAPVFNLVLLAGLIGVTVVYAYSTGQIAKETRQQADASVKLAEETREQRFASVRPVIDLEPQGPGPSPADDHIIALRCQVRNIGIGPVTDLYIPVVLNLRGDTAWKSLGTIGRDGVVEASWVLGTKGAEDRWFLVAHYRDIYGNYFESSREVIPAGSDWKTGLLDIRGIVKEEFCKKPLSVEIVVFDDAGWKRAVKGESGEVEPL